MAKAIFGKLKLICIPCKGNKYKPKFLENKFLFYYTIILLLLKLTIIPFFLYFPKTIFFADLTKTNLIELTNSARQYLGLRPLKENSLLNEAAYLKAKDMIEKDYFAHYSPEGITPWHWLKKSGYNYMLAGENLAIGFLEPEQVHLAWMNSSSHKRNILNPNFQEIGIAVLKGNFQGKETTLVVQFFGTQKTIVLPKKAPRPQVITKEETPKTPVITREKRQVSEEKTKEPIAKEKVVSKPEEAVSVVTEKKFEKTPTLLLLQFMTTNYYNLIQKIIYGSLILVIFSLLVNVFCDIFIYRKFEIQYKDIIFKAIGFSVLWFILLFLDKLTIIKLITHNFRI